MRDTRAVGQRNASAVDVGGRVEWVVSGSVNIEKKQGQGRCAGDREYSQIR
jgi:hypothetical protein